MKDDKLTIFNIADWFLVHESMTHKKLQKLLYLSYGYYIASYNENKESIINEIFENDFEAWVHGPVSPKIYNTYRNAGYNYIMKSKTTPCVINENVEKILYLVLEKYKNYDGDELEKLTHSQTPWIIARGDLSAIEPCSTKILSKDIFTYFQANDMVVQ